MPPFVKTALFILYFERQYNMDISYNTTDCITLTLHTTEVFNKIVINNKYILYIVFKNQLLL